MAVLRHSEDKVKPLAKQIDLISCTKALTPEKPHTPYTPLVDLATFAKNLLCIILPSRDILEYFLINFGPLLASKS